MLFCYCVIYLEKQNKIIMKNIKEHIKKVNNYFTSKIARGDYEIPFIDQNKIVLKVDGEYHFCFWIANGIDSFATWSVSVIDYDCETFMDLHFTPSKKEAAWKRVEMALSKYDNDVQKKKDEEEFERLKKKLGKTCN